jgi:hypothetical protein
MDHQAKLFIKTWRGACLTWVIIIAALNTAVDPYLIVGTPRYFRFNAHKPAVETQERLMKAYDAVRAAPNTITLGSSRVDWGLDAEDPAWPAQHRPVYTLALAGSDPYAAHRYLQHLLAQRRVSLVVLGLDFEHVTIVPKTNRFSDPESESRLVVTLDGDVNTHSTGQHVRDILQATLSLNALTDSMATLAANWRSESPDIVSGNWVTAVNLPAAEPGAYARLVLAEMGFVTWYRGNGERMPINPLVMADVQGIVELALSNGAPVILVINPVYVDALEIMDLSGYWGTFESWKRQLTAMAAKYNGLSDGKVVLWDFTDYDDYSTELLPISQGALHWFFDCGHASKALGDAVIRRIFGAGDPSFGGVLTPENVELRLADIRERQRLFRQNRLADAWRIRNLYHSLTDGAARERLAASH